MTCDHTAGIAPQRFLDVLADADTRSFTTFGGGFDVRITGESVTGAALVFGSRVIHLAAFTAAPSRMPSRPRHVPSTRADATCELLRRSGMRSQEGGLRPASAVARLRCTRTMWYVSCHAEETSRDKPWISSTEHVNSASVVMEPNSAGEARAQQRS